MRIWYLLGTPRELRTEELAPDRSPAVGDILGGREVVRVWPHNSNPFHVWRILFEAGVLGATNLEAQARESGLWLPTESVLGMLREMGFEANHGAPAGATVLHQMLFQVRHELADASASWGEGVTPLAALVDYARRNGLEPSPQSPGTVVPMPMLMAQPDGTVVGPGVAISERLREFLYDERNAMPPGDWAACLLTFAADFAIHAGLGRTTYVATAGDLYDDRRAKQDHG